MIEAVTLVLLITSLYLGACLWDDKKKVKRLEAQVKELDKARCKLNGRVQELSEVKYDCYKRINKYCIENYALKEKLKCQQVTKSKCKKKKKCSKKKHKKHSEHNQPNPLKLTGTINLEVQKPRQSSR